MKDMQYSNFKNKDVSGTDFSNCDLTGSNFVQSTAKNCNFAGAILDYCNFREADVTGSTADDKTNAYMVPWVDLASSPDRPLGISKTWVLVKKDTPVVPVVEIETEDIEEIEDEDSESGFFIFDEYKKD